MKNINGAFMMLTLLIISIVLLAPPAQASAAVGVAANVAGAEQVAPLLSGLPSYRELEARYPQSDAVVLFDSLVVTLDDEHRISKRRHRAVMLFTDNAINRYGDPRILFNAATQELTIIAARVYMRDGTTVDTQKNGMNQTTPFALELAPDYVNWQETVVTHVGIEKGCVAELQYVIGDKTPSPWLSGVETFGAEDPTQARILEIRVPPSVSIKTIGGTGAPEPEKSSNGTWRWAVKDIPGRTPQHAGAWEGDYLPVVCYSTAKNWGEVFQTIAKGVTAASSARVNPASQRDSSFTTKVLDTIKNLSTDEDKILAIHRLALDCVSSVHAPFGCFAAPPRTAERIYSSGYASNLDRTVLLIAMLNAAGFRPEPYLISSGQLWPNDVPVPEICSIMIDASTPAGETMLLDPAAPYEHDLSFTLAGRTSFGCKNNACRAQGIERRSASENRSKLDLVLKKGANNVIEGEGRALLTGLFSPYYLMRGTGTEAENFVKARVGGLFEGAELTSWDPSAIDWDRAELAFNFAVKLPDEKAGERVYLKVPRPFEAGLSGIDRVHLDRSASLDAIRVGPCILEVSCTIEGSQGWNIISLPRRGNEQNEIGSALVTVESAPDGKMTCRKSLTIDGDLVRPGDYSKLRSLLRTFSDDRLVLEKE